MLLPLAGRRPYYDLAGPEDGPAVCITHSLASDGGGWARTAASAAGRRVSRIAARHASHGGSNPVAGDYTMRELAGMSPPCSMHWALAGALHRAVDRRDDRPTLRSQFGSMRISAL